MKTTTKKASKKTLAIKSTDENLETAKVEALENSKKAKSKELPHRQKMAKVYDSFRVLLPEGEKEVTTVKGVVATFWKTTKDSADFGGVTLRFNGENCGGKDRAIVGNIRKALKGLLESNTMTIRKRGSGALFF